MKAIISDRIYLNATEELRTEISNELKYVIRTFGAGSSKPVIIRNCETVNKDIISIPSGRLDLVPKDYDIVDKRCKIEAEFPEFKYTLRESQQKIYDELDSSCMINAAPSWGKTVAAIAIAVKLGLKTLVVVHTVSLRAQWIIEVEKTLGITPGIIGSGKFETDHPIVIANIQTLTKHAAKISNIFGTLIIDECHHIAATTFTKVVNISKATYKIGLSGTLERKDGMHVIFSDYFSPKIFKPPRENMMIPTIFRVPTEIPFSDNSSIPWALRVNELFADKDFLILVIETIMVQVDRGHKVLVVSDRVNFLEYCHEILEEISVCVTGNIHFENRPALIEEVATGDKKVIFGTTSIFSEGISVNALSCLIPTSPINNNSLLTQLIGRVVRLHPGKPTPEVIDFILQGATAKRQANSRLGTYIKEGYTVKELQPIKK